MVSVSYKNFYFGVWHMTEALQYYVCLYECMYFHFRKAM